MNWKLKSAFGVSALLLSANALAQITSMRRRLPWTVVHDHRAHGTSIGGFNDRVVVVVDRGR